MTKVLVTGSNGQVGRALLKSVPAGFAAVGLTRAQLNIIDPQSITNTIDSHRPDLIINTAAYTAVDEAQSNPGAAEAANAVAPGNLAAAAARVGARFIHLSTDFVFDGTASRPYPVDAPTHPLSVYGTTKRDGEERVRQQLPDRSVILRTAWVYASEGNNFVRTMLRTMAARGTVRVVADQFGTPTSADSLAAVLWSLAAAPGVNGTYHWTDAGVATWYDFAVAIAEEAAAMGCLPAQVRVDPISTHEYPTPARRPAFGVLDKSAILAKLPLTMHHWRSRLRTVLREIPHA